MASKFVKGASKFIGKYCSELTYSKLAYLISHKRILNIKHPTLFNEKLYWLKYYNKHNMAEKIRECYDKYRVREYICDRVTNAQDYLPKLYGRYFSANEIDFNELPNKFVLKISQGCGTNILCFDKKSMDFELVARKLDDWLELSKKEIYGDEKFAFDGKSSIICEEMLADGNIEKLNDIRFFCFNGEPRLVSYDIESVESNGDKAKFYYRQTYDMDWKETDINLGRPKKEGVVIDKPINFDRMVEIARNLSKEFVFCRVDQYNIDGKIYIGELTFVPQSGNGVVTPVEYRKILGDMMELPKWEFMS